MNRIFPRMDWYFASARMDALQLQHHKISGAPETMNGLRAAFVSDVHLRRNIPAAPLIDCIKGCRADMIFFGGDFADRRNQALRLFGELSALSAPLGMFAVPGNNDVEAFGSLDELRNALDDCSVRLLVNESVQLGGFAVGGVDEHKYGSPAKSGVFDGKEGYRILISHYPVLPQETVDLMLSGHTHGGQFNAFGLTPYAIGFEAFASKRHLTPAAVSGMHEINGMKLLVSKGIGTSRIPLRIGVRPEVHLLEFEC